MLNLPYIDGDVANSVRPSEQIETVLG